MKNKHSEDLFLIEKAVDLSDSEAVKAFELEFNRKISLAALRKRRQRLGVKKRGYNKTFELEPNA